MQTYFINTNFKKTYFLLVLANVYQSKKYKKYIQNYIQNAIL